MNKFFDGTVPGLNLNHVSFPDTQNVIDDERQVKTELIRLQVYCQYNEIKWVSLLWHRPDRILTSRNEHKKAPHNGEPFLNIRYRSVLESSTCHPYHHPYQG